jgi:hypothetical protein
MNDYPCACGCGALIEFVPYGKQRRWASDACRVRQYRREHAGYVEREREANRLRKRSRPKTPAPTACLCGCGEAPPARAGDVGRHPRYATDACRRRGAALSPTTGQRSPVRAEAR